MYINGIFYDESQYNVKSGTAVGTDAETADVSGSASKKSVFTGYFDKTYSYDGKIDDSIQRDIGNCWLLSDAKALQNTDFGEQAIKDAIDYDHDGSEIDPFEVVIYNSFGEKQTIKVTNSDMEKYLNTNKKYSKGDGDTRLLEAAVAKYFVQEIEAGRMKDRSADDPLEGSPFGKYSLNYMLTGKLPHGLTSYEIKPENAELFDKLTEEGVDEIMNKYADNPRNMAMSVAFKDRTLFEKLFGNTSREQQDSKHAFTILGVSKNDNGDIVSVTYSNPHNSSVKHNIPYEKFKKIVVQMEYQSGDN